MGILEEAVLKTEPTRHGHVFSRIVLLPIIDADSNVVQESPDSVTERNLNIVCGELPVIEPSHTVNRIPVDISIRPQRQPFLGASFCPIRLTNLNNVI